MEPYQGHSYSGGRLSLLLSVFHSFPAVLLKFFTLPALGAALVPAITGAELNVDVSSSRKKWENNVLFKAPPLKAMRL